MEGSAGATRDPQSPKVIRVDSGPELLTEKSDLWAHMKRRDARFLHAGK